MKMAQEGVRPQCSCAHQRSGKPTPGGIQALPIAPTAQGHSVSFSAKAVSKSEHCPVHHGIGHSVLFI